MNSTTIKFLYNNSWTQEFDIDKVPEGIKDIDIDAVIVTQFMTKREYEEYMGELNLNKRFFGYSKYNGGHYPVLYYDSLPTNSSNGKPRGELVQMVEVPEEHINKKIDELVLIYPYKEEENEKAASN